MSCVGDDQWHQHHLPAARLTQYFFDILQRRVARYRTHMTVRMSFVLQNIVHQAIHVVGSSVAPVTYQHCLFVLLYVCMLQHDIYHLPAVVQRIEQRLRTLDHIEVIRHSVQLPLQRLGVVALYHLAVAYDDAVVAVFPQLCHGLCHRGLHNARPAFQGGNGRLLCESITNLVLRKSLPDAFRGSIQRTGTRLVFARAVIHHQNGFPKLLHRGCRKEGEWHECHHQQS